MMHCKLLGQQNSFPQTHTAIRRRILMILIRRNRQKAFSPRFLNTTRHLHSNLNVNAKLMLSFLSDSRQD